MYWDLGLGLGISSDDRMTAEAGSAGVSREIIRRCEKLVAQAGKKRYIENLSYHALRLPFVAAVMPNARIILIIRDPKATIPEILHGWKDRPSFQNSFKTRRRNIKLRTLPRLSWHFARNYFKSRIEGIRESWGPRVPGWAEFAANNSPPEIAAYQPIDSRLKPSSRRTSRCSGVVTRGSTSTATSASPVNSKCSRTTRCNSRISMTVW